MAGAAAAGMAARAAGVAGRGAAAAATTASVAARAGRTGTAACCAAGHCRRALRTGRAAAAGGAGTGGHARCVGWSRGLCERGWAQPAALASDPSPHSHQAAHLLPCAQAGTWAWQMRRSGKLRNRSMHCWPCSRVTSRPSATVVRSQTAAHAQDLLCCRCMLLNAFRCRPASGHLLRLHCLCLQAMPSMRTAS